MSSPSTTAGRPGGCTEVVPASEKGLDGWSAAEKFTVVLAFLAHAILNALNMPLNPLSSNEVFMPGAADNLEPLRRFRVNL
jgi:hypothetical protein